ncbi:MAG: adenylate kinase [Chloroflexi bacterium RBG_13_54_8]|nr:MAG: adenylate kinase [Chloroflexi bacterium RBG_13_54_8]
MRLILLGAPGSGKGTQAERISEATGLVHVASGDLFRQAAKEGTELGKLAKSYMDKGLLVPDDVTAKMILERIAGLSRGFMLDGFPRTIQQAQALDKALGKKSIDKVLYIKVSEEELLRRLSGRWICRQCQSPYHLVSSPPKVAGQCDHCGGELYQRSDDTMETAQKRLEVYFAQTAPLIDYYEQSGRLAEIDGERRIEEVGKELLGLLT